MARNKTKIMIVDDESTSRMLLTRMLHKHYNLIVVAKSEDCLYEAPQHLPDVILIDIIMPALDGYQVCKWLKDNEATRQIPLVLISSLDPINQQQDYAKSGAVAFLEKPITKDVLLSTINTAMASSAPIGQ